MSKDLYELKEKLIYSFSISNEDICSYENDYVESGKRQSVESFSMDVVNMNQASLLEKTRNFLKFNLITFLQIICFAVIIFVDKTNVFILYTALFMYMILEIVFIIKVNNENIVLNMLTYKTNKIFFIISFLIPFFLVLLHSTDLCYSFFEASKIGIYCYHTTLFILIFSAMFKVFLSFFRYKYVNCFSINLLLLPSLITSTLYISIYQNATKFYEISINFIPFFFLLSYVTLIFIVFANKRKVK